MVFNNPDQGTFILSISAQAIEDANNLAYKKMTAYRQNTCGFLIVFSLKYCIDMMNDCGIY